MSVYPNSFDSDLEIPRVDKNVTEISGETINSLRDAVFAIQRSLGLNIQGNKASLSDRINVSIDANGFIKRSAIENLGLVSLPIDDRHVGNNAGIKESKLALDFPTSALSNRISSLKTDLDGIASGLSSNVAAFNLHILGQANFHDGYQIKVNLGSNTGIAGLEATTIGDAVNEIGSFLLSGNESGLVPHIDLGLPSSTKHRAEEISVSSINFTNIARTATNVQAALDNIDATQGALGVSHVDNFHSNGILKNINSGTDFNPNRIVLNLSTGAFYTEGTGVITFPNITSFSEFQIEPGDILEIADPQNIADLGNYQIRAIGPLPASKTLGDLPELDENQIAIFHTFVESREQGDNIFVNVYKPASISSELAPLACAVRNNETIVDTVSVLPPEAARVVSLGFNGSILNADGYEIAIRAGIGNGVTREVVIPDLNRERLQTNQANPVSSKTVAERINAYLSDPDIGLHFPVSAYPIGNELAIAHNLVGQDYTLEIIDGYSANFSLGLDAYGANLTGKVQVGNLNNSYSVNGISRSSVEELFDGYGKVLSDTSTFMLYTPVGQLINPLRFGIRSGSVIHITEHPTKDTNGSYTLFSTNSSGVSLFSSETIDAPSDNTTFNVSVSSGHVSLTELSSVEITQGLVELYVNANGKIKAHQRLIYGTTLGSGVEIIGISNNFPVDDFAILVGLEGDFINFNIIDDTLSGRTVRINENFIGQFKLYHPNNLDFITIKIVQGNIPGGIETFTVNEPLNFDECLKLSTLHFNGSLSITNVMDNRQFGNVSSEEIRDDFVEIFSQRPVSDLRSNGVARGFDVLDIPFFDVLSGMEALPVEGGIAYVNGARVAVETQKVIVPSQDSEGNVLSNVRRIVAINEFGTLTVVSDELGELLSDGYESSVAFGELLPLYEITIQDGGINRVTDLRLFINNIDDKIELIVDETNNVVGNFRSLEGALLYASKYPGLEKLTIKIINTVTPSRAVVVPKGVSLIGSTPFGGNGTHRILNEVGSFSGSSFIKLEGNNRIENLSIESQLVELQAPLVEVSGSNVVIEKCLLEFGAIVTSNSSLTGINVAQSSARNVQITNNRINNIYTGISSLWGCEDLRISDNVIENVSGTGGISTGISLSTLTRPVKTITVKNNIVRIPSVVQPSDLRGITLDVREAVDVLRIEDNSIIHEVENTMTNGIRITSELDGGTGNKVINLSLTDNYITGIRLDDNGVYGIYLDDIEEAFVYRNSINNVGVSGANRSDTAMLLMGDRLDYAEVDNNKFKNGDVLRGIVYNNASGRANITNNTFYNIGDEAQCIRGTAPYSNISGNTITGPSKIGIRWQGARSKISDNLMNSISATDYSFEEYAIYVQTSDIDVVNNTITDMRYENAIGPTPIAITNVTSANDRVKVLGNTISGDKVVRFIDLYGSYQKVSNNKIYNESVNVNTGSFGVFVNSVTESVFSDNVFDGDISAGFSSGASTISKLTLTGNVVNPTPVTASVVFAGTTTDCSFLGNRFPDGDPDDNSRLNLIGGTVLSPAVPNENLIGPNRGLQDRITLPASSGMTGYETVGSYADAAHWAMKDGNTYWEANRSGASGTRYLYFPLIGMPNGSRINRVDVLMRTGQNNNASSWNIQGFKRDINSVDGGGNSIETAITNTPGSVIPQSAPAITSGTADTTFYVWALEADGEVVDYRDKQYFITISNSESSPTDIDEIRVYGITIRFTY